MKPYSNKIKNLDNFIPNHKSWDKNNLMSWINSLRNWKLIRTIILKNLSELFKIIKIKENKPKFYQKKLNSLRLPWLKKLKNLKQNMIWKSRNLNKSLLNNNKLSQNNNLQLLVRKPQKKLLLWSQGFKKWKTNWNSVKANYSKLMKVN